MSSYQVTQELYDSISDYEEQRLAQHPMEFHVSLDTILKNLPSRKTE